MFVLSTQQNLRLRFWKWTDMIVDHPAYLWTAQLQSLLLPACCAEELLREDFKNLSLWDYAVTGAEAACCCILSYLHEGRGLVIRWILMYQLTSWQTPLPHSGCLGLTVWDIKTLKRPQWTLIFLLPPFCCHQKVWKQQNPKKMTKHVVFKYLWPDLRTMKTGLKYFCLKSIVTLS